MYFTDVEYVLATVRAEVTMKWPNQQEEDYRFYYPYQELIINPVITGPVTESAVDMEEDSSLVVQLLIALVVVLIAVVVGLAGVNCYRRYIKVPRLLVEEDLPSRS